jgi:hypothetical protein
MAPSSYTSTPVEAQEVGQPTQAEGHQTLRSGEQHPDRNPRIDEIMAPVQDAC